MHITGTATATLNCSIDHAWEVLADHVGMSSWGPGIKVELTKAGTEHPNGVGAVRRITAPGPVPAIVEEITAFEPETFLAYRALSGVPLKDYRGEVELADRDGKTWVTYSVHADSRVPYLEKAAVKGIATGLLGAFKRAAQR